MNTCLLSVLRTFCCLGLLGSSISRGQTVSAESGPDNTGHPTGSSTSVDIGDWDYTTQKWNYSITCGPGQVFNADSNPPREFPAEGGFQSTFGDGTSNGTVGPATFAGEIAPFTIYSLTASVLGSSGYEYQGMPVTGVIGSVLNPFLQTQNLSRLDFNAFTRGGAVQLATGAESSHRTLFSFRGARNWSFILSYNSILARSINGGFPAALTTYTPMAMGWSHNFQARIAPSPTGDLVVYWDEARYNTFTPTSGNPNLFASSEDGARYDTIAVQSGGGWLLTHRDQSSLLFNSSGQLIEDRDPQGRKLVMTYGGGVPPILLLSITEPISGTRLSFNYSGTGLPLTSITDGTGASVSLGYQPTINLNLLTTINTQNGDILNFTYDANFQFSTLTDATGAQLTKNTNDYSNGYKVVTQVDARDAPSGFNYSTVNGQPTTVYTDRNGKHETHTYDSNYNELSVTDALNETTSHTYDSANRITSVTDPLGRTTAYAYDSQGNLLTSTDPAGKVTTFTYDGSNNLLTVTDPLGQVTTRTYDGSNNLLTLKDPLGQTTTWTYDTNSLPLTMTLPRGGAYHYSYTAGQLTQVTDPNGVATAFGYDADGRMLYKQDALGNRTTYTYDGAGNVLTVTNPLSQTTTYVCDIHNRVTSVTDPTGAVTTYTYDGNNNRTSVTDALGHVTHYTYDGENRLLTIVDPLNLKTSFAYDAVGHLLNVTDPHGHVTSYQYDAAGQTIAVVDPLNKATAKSYDVRGLLLAITDPLNRTTNYTYDTLGRQITALDPLSRQTSFGYDPLSRLTQVTDPGSLVGSQAYDSDGNRVSFTNPAGSATALTYDAGGRLTAATTPQGNITGYAYDPRGLPLTVTQPSSNATSFSYDNAMRLSSYTDPVATVSYGRDADGRVLTTNDGSKVLTRAYDALGRITSYTDGNGNVFGYQYDFDGRLTQLTYPGGKTVTYAYDASSKLTTVTDWAGRVTTYSYDNDERVTKLQRPDGSVQTSTYDSAGQLTQVADLKADQVTVIYSGSYGLDLAGQLTSETLVPALTPTASNATQTVDLDNRLLTFNGSAVTFDANGNLLSIASGVAPASYSYDARNRLTAAGGGVSYTYDSDNRRVALTDSTGTTNFAINPNATLDQVLVKTAPNGTQTFYVYGLGLLHEETNGVATFYHHDRLGNTVALTNSAGAVTGQISYGTYGEIISETGTVTTPFLFNGRWGVQTDSNGLWRQPIAGTKPTLAKIGTRTKLLETEAVRACLLPSERCNERSLPSIRCPSATLLAPPAFKGPHSQRTG